MMSEETPEVGNNGSDNNQDDLILNQQRQIEKEIAECTPLVGGKEAIDVLIKEYANDPVYLGKTKLLAQTYHLLRRTRPDGNCFFRAFGYACFEKLLEEKEDYPRFQEVALKSKDALVALGFPQFTVEDFYDTFMDTVNKIGKGLTHEELLTVFQDQGLSDYIVVYLRLLTSGQLQQEQEFYSNFVEGDRTVKEFCQQEVEPMFRESDHIHAIALSTALGIGVRILYMDRGTDHQVPAHDFPEGLSPKVHLLYRPGHYDILYVK
nr:EOG090X0AE1 [Lepidurus arcticus]